MCGFDNMIMYSNISNIFFFIIRRFYGLLFIRFLNKMLFDKIYFFGKEKI